MAEKEIPNYIFKLGIPEEVVAKAVSKILEDFNVYMDEEKALKLLYGLLTHLIHYIDVHPGQYLKLKYLDITSDKGSLLNIKASSDFAEEMIDANMLYNKFCSETMLKEELQKSVNAFAQSFLGIREEKVKEVRKLDNVIRRRRQAQEEAKKCTEIVRFSDKLQKQVEKERKAEQRKAQREFKKKLSSYFVSNAERYYRDKYKKQSEAMEQDIIAKWKLNKYEIPFE